MNDLIPLPSVGKPRKAEALDARLIAAAPDLLNALDGLLDYLRDYDADYPEAAPIFGKARAAIAKATGENA